MAIVAPSFLLFIFAIVEVALWMHARDVALAAAREGVSKLRTVDSNQAAGDWENVIAADAELFAQQIGAIQNVSATTEYSGDPDDPVTVTVTGDVIDLIPGWDLTVEASASGLLETFRPDYGEPR
jgi:Flp pilus assembly protein TadG